MMQIKFLRENISLSVGIPVFESLAHVNIGFYEDTLKKLPIGDQKRIIGAFIDKYSPAVIKSRTWSFLRLHERENGQRKSRDSFAIRKIRSP